MTMPSPSPSDNPVFKLRYFYFKGLGEPIRFLFAYAGQSYEDIRISVEEWPSVKPSTPMGQLPLLEVDGVIVHQSGTILRYLSKRFGLAGSNDFEDLLIDSVADTLTEFRIKLSAPFYEADEEAKAQKKVHVQAEVVPFYLEKLEAMAKKNNGYLALPKLTMVDLHFASMYDYFSYLIKTNFLETYPNLKRVVDNVYALDSIKAWLAKRPENNYERKSTFKLRYFNIKGLAEPIRFVLAYAGQEYEDIRVSQEDWPAIKPTTPFGQMPILEVDGLVASQSVRYLAKRFGLTGSNDWEELLVDSVADTFADFRQKLIAPWYETNEEVKAQKKAILESETIPFYLERLERCAKENNGHLALSKLTYADLYFSSMVDSLNVMIKPDFLEQYPNLKRMVDNVYALDSIKAWVAKRPVTEY